MINNTINFIFKRVEGITELPVTVGYTATLACKTIAGVAASALSILTLGLNSKINKYANEWTVVSAQILVTPYGKMLKIINPNAQCASKGILMGVITEKLANPIFQKAWDEAQNESFFFRKHVVSRGAYALGALVATITRTADFVLGLLALPVSFITLGTFEKINTFTYKQLSFPAFIGDVCVGMRGLVNPQQFNTTN